MKIYNGYKRLNENYSLLTDDYEFKMASGYLDLEKNVEEAVFDVFFRKIPNDGGYAIMAGIDKVIEYIMNLKFEERELNYFERNGYSSRLINYLKNFKFTGDIYAIPDGTPVFPNEPIITIKAPIVEAQIIETALLSMINGAMEHATGARRIIEATPNNVGVMEFGARRADGLDAANDSSIYGIMAGCSGTSNCMAADMLNMKALGTMAHSFVESFDDEYTAFKAFANIYPDNCILLVDTYDTLKSGIPNAIKTFEYMEKEGLKTNNIGIRIDSGDLVKLSKEARKMLNEVGFPQAKICLSNGLTAENIESLVLQGAKFDSLGVGDNISKPNGRMGCVYKEVALKENEKWIPKMKLSNDIAKIVNPGYKKIYRAYDKNTGYAISDIMAEKNEDVNKTELTICSLQNSSENITINNFDLVELQKPIFENGVLVYEDLDIKEKKEYCQKQMDTICPEIKKTTMPQKYNVAGTREYVEFKDKLIDQTKHNYCKI